MSLFLVGALAGLGVAMPLGAIGVLLVREGMRAGFRIAAAGALAVALVDTAYCVLAVTVGAVAAPWIESLGTAPTIVAGLVLIVLGALGLRKPGTATPSASDEPAARAVGGVFARFAALTAINPATLLYFAALTAALNASPRPDGGLAPFVVGVAVASGLWQVGLAGVGAAVGSRLSGTGQRVLSVGGSAVVLALGLSALVTGVLAVA